MRRGRYRGANGGWWGDDGRPESQARSASASVHDAFPGAAERSGGGVAGRNRPDEGFGEDIGSKVSTGGVSQRNSTK